MLWLTPHRFAFLSSLYHCYLSVLIDVFVKIGIKMLSIGHTLKNVFFYCGFLKTFFLPSFHDHVLFGEFFLEILQSRVFLQRLLNQQLELHFNYSKTIRYHLTWSSWRVFLPLKRSDNDQKAQYPPILLLEIGVLLKWTLWIRREDESGEIGKDPAYWTNQKAITELRKAFRLLESQSLKLDS